MQDDQTRRALLDGRWDEPKVGGGIYTEVLNKAREAKAFWIRRVTTTVACRAS